MEDHSTRFIRISIEEAKTLIESYPELAIADIRDSKSYNLSNIKNSINLNNDNIKQFLRETRKETPLLIYCYHGVNSQEAADYFIREGFREVYSLDGGFSDFSKYI